MEAVRGKRVPDYLLDMIDSYLSDRTLIYETDQGEQRYTITAGVPQGSVLGPILWNIMYDALLELEQPEGAELVGFADDVAIVVTARSAEILEIVANDSLQRTRRWLESAGLEMASQKTEATLITSRRAFVKPGLQLGTMHIPWSKSIRYLGVQLDRLSFATHLIRTAEKAAACAASMARLMPNIGGPSDAERRLLISAVCAKVLYAAPIWADAMKQGPARKLGSVLRISAIRIVSAYRTVSESAILVLAGMPPVDLMAKERKEIHEEMRENTGEQNKRQTQARQRLLQKWQIRWDTATTGRWTHKLIPTIKPWIERKHGNMNYYLTQAFTGHGSFNAYLSRFGKKDRADCDTCGHKVDDAHHAIFECQEWNEARTDLEKELEATFTADNLVPLMLASTNKWNKVKEYITKVLRNRENPTSRKCS